MMTNVLARRVAILNTELATARDRIKALRDDNQRLWESREDWKRKHREREAEITELRRKVKRLEEARAKWRSRAVAKAPPAVRLRKPKPNVFLSHYDVKRIMRMTPRD